MCSPSLRLVSIVLEVLAKAVKQEIRIKYIGIRKEVKLSLFADIENPKSSTKKNLLDLINAFNKFPIYKINI